VGAGRTLLRLGLGDERDEATDERLRACLDLVTPRHRAHDVGPDQLVLPCHHADRPGEQPRNRLRMLGVRQTAADVPLKAHAVRSGEWLPGRVEQR
jgi:hypothetical protein